MPAHIYRQDYYGHEAPLASNGSAAALAAGAVSTTAVGTIAPTTASGASPTVTFGTGQVAYDQCGTFTLNPVTGGGAQAAGAQVVVTFQNAFERAPAAVNVNICDNAAGTGGVPVAAAAQSITAAGFTINTAALTTAHNYTVSYNVES